jgi:hypothetical protein
MLVREKRNDEELYEFSVDNELVLDIIDKEPAAAARRSVEWIANKEWCRRHRDESRRTVKCDQHNSIKEGASRKEKTIISRSGDQVTLYYDYREESYRHASHV